MKTDNIQQLVSEALKGMHLIPIRAYFKHETGGQLHLKVPVLKEGTKHMEDAVWPAGLVYYTFNDHKNKEKGKGKEEQGLFMLVPLNIWSMTFGARQPGWTWTAPQKFNVFTSVNGKPGQ